ncbi:MAG: archaellin/type IV pilin N-terminal domain-containing protein [Candidatus Aenigmatarchaeota archaeon]
MRGISTVIATILMLMITIGLAGTAYLYISGAFTQQTQGIDLVDAFCTGGIIANVSFRNLGTTDISFANGDCTPSTGSPTSCGSIGVTRTSGGGTASIDGINEDTTIEPGTAASFGDSGCATSGNPITCIYRITPPSGRSVVATVSCTG